MPVPPFPIPWLPATVSQVSCGLIEALTRKTHKKSLSEVVEDVKLLFSKDLTEQRQQPGQ